MRRRRVLATSLAGSVVAAISMIIAATLVPVSASATDNVTRFQWHPGDPTFHISTSMPSGWRWDARLGAGRWKSKTKFQPQYGGTTSSTWVGTSIHNVVMREIPDEWADGCPPSKTIACTYIWGHFISSGHIHIADGDIIFNEDFYDSMTTSDGLCAWDILYDVATVSLHEFGHFAGLDHSWNSDSRMWPNYLGCRRYPHQHDIDAMNANMPHS